PARGKLAANESMLRLHKKPACLLVELPFRLLPMNRPSVLILLATLLVGGISRAQTSPTPAPIAKPSPSVPPADYTLQWGAKIPMRDNVELNATLYLPKSGSTTPSRTPIIFTLKIG